MKHSLCITYDQFNRIAVTVENNTFYLLYGDLTYTVSGTLALSIKMCTKDKHFNRGKTILMYGIARFSFFSCHIYHLRNHLWYCQFLAKPKLLSFQVVITFPGSYSVLTLSLSLPKLSKLYHIYLEIISPQCIAFPKSLP